MDLKVIWEMSDRRSHFRAGTLAPNVRYWLLADLFPDRDLCPLYPRKRTFFSTGVYVRL